MRARGSISVAPGPTRGDAGRRAGSARAQRYVAGITPVLEAIMRDQGRSAQAVAIELTRRAVRKPRGGVIWTSADAQRLLRRLNLRPARHLGHKHRERETSSPAFCAVCAVIDLVPVGIR
jgi:hypothetical protein